MMNKGVAGFAGVRPCFRFSWSRIRRWSPYHPSESLPTPHVGCEGGPRRQGIVDENAPRPQFPRANPHASGKTRVLQAVDLAVRAAIKQDPRELFVDDLHCDWLDTRNGQGALQISCETEEGRCHRLGTPRNGPDSTPDGIGPGDWDFGVSPSLPSDRCDALGPAQSCSFLRLPATQLAKPSDSDRVPPKMGLDGEGLASVLAHLALNDPDALEQLVDRLRELIPHLRRIRFKKVPVRRQEKELGRFGDDTVERSSVRSYQGEAMLFDFERAANVAAHMVSEGTLLLLGLFTVLLGPAHPGILLLDDIEQGLHPLSQKRLIGVLGDLVAKSASLQILATSHSPYLLDFLQPDQVRLLSLDASGHAICGRLADHPQFEKWTDEMAPGEMWSLFGKSWLAEGDVPKWAANPK